MYQFGRTCQDKSQSQAGMHVKTCQGRSQRSRWNNIKIKVSDKDITVYIHVIQYNIYTRIHITGSHMSETSCPILVKLELQSGFQYKPALLMNQHQSQYVTSFFVLDSQVHIKSVHGSMTSHINQSKLYTRCIPINQSKLYTLYTILVSCCVFFCLVVDQASDLLGGAG